MSRGPGRWQRAVIEACERAAPAWVTVDAVHCWGQDQRLPAPVRRVTGTVVVDCDANSLPQHLAPATREAIRRAIRTLAASGRIESTVVLCRRHCALPNCFWKDSGYAMRDVLAARIPTKEE
jgi:hypothetical protein